MEKKLLSLKPILWKLVIYKGVPFFATFGIGMIALYSFSILQWQPFSLQILGLFIVVGSILVIISSVFSLKVLEIEVSTDKISGPSAGFFLNRETISISDLERLDIYKQSLYERISGTYPLLSRNGHKILLTHFIYEESAIKEVYRILRQWQAQF